MNGDRELKVLAGCICGGVADLWVPPTVKCRSCGAVYVWDDPARCVSSGEGRVAAAGECGLHVEVCSAAPLELKVEK